MKIKEMQKMVNKKIGKFSITPEIVNKAYRDYFKSHSTTTE